MMNRAVARPTGASTWQDAAIIWGTESLLVGWLVPLIARRVQPGAVLGMSCAEQIEIPPVSEDVVTKKSSCAMLS